LTRADDAPRVSIVINTLDRAPYLRRLLATLGHLEYPDFEVVVVNGPSVDDTEGILDEVAGQVKVVRCPAANLARSRNVGIEAAAGEVITFIDDDALPASPDWLAALTRPFAREAELGGAGGPVLVGDTEVFESADGAVSEYGLQAFGDAARDPRGGQWFQRVGGTNCAFRRDVLVAIGGFDEAYEYFAEETDVCVRIARAGFAVRFVADAVVRHHRARSATRRSFHDRDWRIIARSDGYFAMKNARDPLLRRVVTAFRLLPLRDPIRHINEWYRAGHFGPDHRLRYLTQGLRGYVSGLRRGITAARRTALGHALPPPFLKFVAPRPPRRLRIGLLCRDYLSTPGGVATYTRELALGLHALGHEVHVFAESREPLRREGLRLLVHGVVPEAEPLTHALPDVDRQLRWTVAAARRATEFARGGTVLDIVESPNWDAEGVAIRRAGLWPVVVHLVSPLPVVAETHGFPPSSDLDAAIALERWLIASADGVTTSSDAVRRTVRETMGIDVTGIACHARIPLGVAPGPPVSPPPANPPRLLFVGRLEPRKGIEVLLAALPALLERHGDLVVDLVGDDRPTAPGDTTYAERFARTHQRQPWRRRVRFHGRVDGEGLLAFYRDCTVFVAPSRYESFGLVYLEAMRWGKPVVGCRTGGVAEVVRDSATGLLVPPDDAAALGAAIGRVLADGALARRLGEAARATVRTEFAARRMADRTAAFYMQVLAPGHRRAGASVRIAAR